MENTNPRNRPPKYDAPMREHHIFFPDSLWQELAEQAKLITLELGRNTTPPDLIRKGAEDLLKKLRKR